MLVNHYAKRWAIGPAFRDTKDLRFGMALSSTRIGQPIQRDRLLLIGAFAMVLLTLRRATGESFGMDRLLESKTSKVRSRSLFREGCMLCDLLPMRPYISSRDSSKPSHKPVPQASTSSGRFVQSEQSDN